MWGLRGGRARNLWLILGHDILGLGVGVLARPISMLLLLGVLLIVLAALGIAGCLPRTMLLLLGVLFSLCWLLFGLGDVDISPAHRSLVAILGLAWRRWLLCGSGLDVYSWGIL